MVSPLSPGTGRNVLLEVVAVVVVNFDACRSMDELDPPEAASTAAGIPSAAATARTMMNILRMRPPPWCPAGRAAPAPADLPGLQIMCDPREDRVEHGRLSLQQSRLPAGRAHHGAGKWPALRRLPDREDPGPAGD